MANFRKAQSSTQASGGFSPTNLVLKPGSGFTWINAYLKDGTTTRLRIFPSFDPETGEEDLALNPEAIAGLDPEKSFGEIFGPFVFRAELTDCIGTNTASFISGVTHDRAGVPIREGWSPAKVMLRRLRYKLDEAALLIQAGMSTDIPPSWSSWVRRSDRICKLPANAMLVQCMAYEVSGQVKQNLQTGEKEWISPAIYSIPRSAQPLFLQDASQRMNPDKDLDLDNNMFGDFCSLSKGRMVLVRKIPASGDSTSNTYNLKPADVYPLEYDFASNVTKAWDQILDIPVVEDVIEKLIQSFDGIAVDYGLRDSSYAQYIPEAYAGSSANIKDCSNLKELRAKIGNDAPASPEGNVPKAPRATPTPAQPASKAVIDVNSDFTEDAESFDESLRRIAESRKKGQFKGNN